VALNEMSYHIGVEQGKTSRPNLMKLARSLWLQACRRKMMKTRSGFLSTAPLPFITNITFIIIRDISAAILE
jgi:hypothetical protein